jgi:hypothetical protein
VPLKKFASKAIEAGVNTALPAALKVAGKIVDSPAGPVFEKAVGAGGKVISPVVSLLRGGTQKVGSGAPGSNGAVQVAPATAPLTSGLPMPTYDSLTLPAILDGLNGLTVAELRVIRTHEIDHENRLPVIDRIDELLASVDATP